MGTEKSALNAVDDEVSSSSNDNINHPDLSPNQPSYGANRNPSTKKSFVAWFDSNDGPLERRVITKLDIFILSYAFIAFWVSRRQTNYEYRYMDALLQSDTLTFLSGHVHRPWHARQRVHQRHARGAGTIRQRVRAAQLHLPSRVLRVSLPFSLPKLFEEIICALKLT